MSDNQQNYTLFEGDSIKQFIIDQLNADGIYVDQEYLGSNMNAFIDIIAVMLQQIQFHYNKTATESTFATATLFENMNKLVSLFNYKPTGAQTSIVPINLNISISEQNKTGTFVIPRYSFFNYNYPFILKSDVSFLSLANEETNIEELFYQGTLTESEVFIATGEEYSTIYLNDNNIDIDKFITDNFFDVYVQEPNSRWIQYTEVHSLFEHISTETVFEKRLNENLVYEFKFGNGVNGYNPPAGSKIIIFYLISDGVSAELGGNTVNSELLFLYNSVNYQNIIKDQTNGIFESLPNFITSEDLININVSNSGASTKVTTHESVEIMKNNVPKLFSIQNRLLTSNDYTTFINKNFGSFIKDTYVFNNEEYTGAYLKYYYNLGLNRPNDDPRVSLNQVTFQSSCGFNNIYVVMLPLINTIINNQIPNYVASASKQYVIEYMNPYKDLVHNIAPLDPIYKAVSFGIARSSNNTLPKHFDDVKLKIVRDKYSLYNTDYIISNTISVFENYFNNVSLGDTINLSDITSKLSQILGVKQILMTDGVNETVGLTFIVWNPLYENEDFMITQQNVLLEPYMYQYFMNIQNLKDKIEIINE